MPEPRKTIDGHAARVGPNLEVLLFTLGADPATGRNETYGIDVFKVREVMRAPTITRAPDTRAPLAGMMSLRGALIPVIDLAQCAGLPATATNPVMILTEYGGRTQGILVQAVDSILRFDGAMQVPPGMLACGARSLVTAVAELGDGRLIMMLDIEKVLPANPKHASAARDDSVQPFGDEQTVLA